MPELSLRERLQRLSDAPALATMPSFEDLPAFDDLPTTPPAGKGTSPAPQAAAPTAAPAPTGAGSRVALFDRMSALSAAGRRPAAATPPRPASGHPQPGRERIAPPQRPAQLPPLAWDDPERPAGSVYSLQQWRDAAEQSGLGEHAVVFEVHKPAEYGLVVMDARVGGITNALFLDRALLIDEGLVDHPAAGNAGERLEHYSHEFGRRSYKVVHARAALEAQPYTVPGTCMRVGPAALIERHDAERSMGQRMRLGR